LTTSPAFKKDTKQSTASISPSKRVSFKQLDTQFGKDVIYEVENEDELIKESKELNESKNIIQEYEEELKECFPSDRDMEKKDEAFSPEQMSKKTPSYFMDKKSSLDMSKLFPSNASPRNNNFFTRNIVEHLGKQY
jgi:antitoxin component of MazEF toxin-antitoxin module